VIESARRTGAPGFQPGGDEDLRNLARVATLYYLEDRTQQEVAAMLGVSRFAVGRLLKRAREIGVVRIEITPVDGTAPAIGTEVERALGLRLCVVAPTTPGADSVGVRRQIGEAGARYLDGIVRDGQTICVPWGRTLAELAARLRPQSHSAITVCELVGGVARMAGGFAAHEVAARIAERLGGTCLFVQAPILVDDAATRAVLLAEASVRRTLAVAARADIAILGVGAATADIALIPAGFLTPTAIAEIAAAGAVAYIGGWFVDREGRELATPLTDRAIALPLDKIRRIPTKIVVAGGAEKVPGIVAAAHGGLMDVLVTDADTAAGVLDLARRSQDGRR
jgi:DNA-binding transcriptional regulator LsrR (DeoR family)